MVASADLLRRAAQICVRPLTTKAMREQIVALVRDAMAFDAYNFALTDPVSRIGTSPLADIPGLPWARLPELIRWRYATPAGRWDRLVEARSPATSVRAETAGGPDVPWADVQRELGVSDTAVVVFADRYGCWGFLDLWRTGGAEFTDAELRLLASLAAPVSLGLRQAIARTFADPPDQPHALGPAVVILGADLQVQAQTEAAGVALLRLNPPDEAIAPIPAAAYNIAAALLAAETGRPIGPPWSRVHLGGCEWVTLKASRLESDVAVSIEPSTPQERMDMYARASGLSERESQVLDLLAHGMETREIATELVVSEHTAADHIKSVLAKTGAGTRQKLLARGLGAR